MKHVTINSGEHLQKRIEKYEMRGFIIVRNNKHLNEMIEKCDKLNQPHYEQIDKNNKIMDRLKRIQNIKLFDI